MSEDQKNRRKEITEKNKSRRVNIELLHDHLESVKQGYSKDNIRIKDKTMDYNQELNPLNINIDQKKTTTLIHYQANSNGISEQDIQEVEGFIKCQEIINRSCEVYKYTLDRMRSMRDIPRPFENQEYNFNVLEDFRLKELDHILPPLERKVDWHRIVCEVNDMTQMVTMGNLFWERQIHRFVQSVKAMTAFQYILENDRHSLVKYASYNILMHRAVFLYDSNDDCWLLPIVSH